MPREWFDRHQAMAIDDPDMRQTYLSILADKKPYFMRYIYPDLMKQYNTYTKNTDKKAQREFSMSIEELLSARFENLTEEQKSFVRYYNTCMPVGMSNCVMNRICRRFEAAFDHYLSRKSKDTEFDYTIMKWGEEYSQSQYNTILRLLGEYNRRLRDYTMFASRERVDEDESSAHMQVMRIEFRNACDAACSNARALCDILLDICYSRNCTKHFVWNMCGKELVESLLQKNDMTIHFPVLDDGGDIQFAGNRFSIREKRLEVDDGDRIE